jgi:hypothetical protein
MTKREDRTCYNCKHDEANQELTQDRLDVDIVHFCTHKDDYIYEDTGKYCKYFKERV